jgi:regulator of CtrA degradation
MSQTANISPSIIETLYEDALLLADEARASFDFDDGFGSVSKEASAARVAMSCEALRTTTRMMHAIAWLLNQRAYLAGEISEFQLRHHGRLPPAQPTPERDQMALLPPYIADLVDRSVQFYARVERLDRSWRNRFELQPAAVHRLRERLGYAFSR